MSVRRGWLVALFLVAAMVGAPVLRAQTDTTAVTVPTTDTTIATTTTVVDDDDDDDDSDFPWGLLGLLGLAGLIPRKGRDVHVHETHTRTVPPRDDRIDPTPPPRV